MLDFVLIAIALALGGGQGGDAVAAAPSQTQAPAATPGLVAEPQVPTGKFTTALEVRPILDATRASWVAVRDYGGQDLLYVTHLLAWRCGLAQLRYGVNGAPLQVWNMPPCDAASPTPNAITGDNATPYIALPAGSVRQIEIELTYDDLSVDTQVFDRAAVQLP